MPCLCSANTLRLFIKSIAHVDIPSSVVVRASPRQFQKTSIRCFTSTRAIHEQHSSSGRNDPASVSSDRTIAFDRPSQNSPKSPGLKPGLEGSNGEGNQQASNIQVDEKSAFVDLSPESIDSLATELVAESARKGSVEAGRGGLTPKGRRDAASSDGPSRTSRRAKTQNTEDAIRSSSPPTSLKAAATAFSESKPGTIPNARSPDTKEDEWTPPPREHWQIDKAALKEKFPDGWNPRKRLSPDALAGIRALHAQMPEQYTTAVLAETFKVSPEAMRRILKSKWAPNADEEMDRQRRWFNRGKNIYTKHAELGLKPPKRWRDLGIGNGKPEWKKRKAAEREAAAAFAKEPLPALITTARRRDAKYGVGRGTDLESFSDTIL